MTKNIVKYYVFVSCELSIFATLLDLLEWYWIVIIRKKWIMQNDLVNG